MQCIHIQTALVKDRSLLMAAAPAAHALPTRNLHCPWKRHWHLLALPAPSCHPFLVPELAPFPGTLQLDEVTGILNTFIWRRATNRGLQVSRHICHQQGFCHGLHCHCQENTASIYRCWVGLRSYTILKTNSVFKHHEVFHFGSKGFVCLFQFALLLQSTWKYLISKNY